MRDWEKWFIARDWQALENWWLFTEDLEAVAAFRDRLHAEVPKITRQNGLEARVEHVTPTEAPSEWKGAAKILHLGELDAYLDGDPEPASEAWRKEREVVEGALLRLLEAGEVTSGDSSLSRNAHAKEALELMELMDREVSWLLPKYKKKYREEFLENASRFMHLGFLFGSSSRSALGKEFERHAIRGAKVVQASSESAQRQAKERQPETNAILSKMQARIDAGHSMRAAALHAADAGLGKSQGGNIKLWQRHRNAKKS